MIEGGDAFLPLFAGSDIPLELNGLVPENVKYQPLTPRRGSNTSLFADENLFNMFMGCDMRMLQEDPYFAQNGVVPDAKLLAMADPQRQFVQVGVVPELNGAEISMSPATQKATQMYLGIFSTEQFSSEGKRTINTGRNNSRRRGSSNEDGLVKRKRSRTSEKAMKAESANSPISEDLDSPSLNFDPSTPMNPEEERMQKRQRRLVKNREAAQLFRQRQKAYIQDLEKKVSELSAINNDLRGRVDLLLSENKLIKEQLVYLRNFITQAVSASFPKLNGTPTPSMQMSAVSAMAAMSPNMHNLMGVPMPGLTTDNSLSIAPMTPSMTPNMTSGMPNMLPGMSMNPNMTSDSQQNASEAQASAGPSTPTPSTPNGGNSYKLRTRK